jgi:GT2 family glycosyltransferase
MNLGFVVIGRNEGQRLVDCLTSISRTGCPVVYVDSGSTDRSLANADGLGAEIVELDMATPFTAARARNAGMKALLSARPDLTFVHFIDGDCALAPDWLDKGYQFISSRPDVAIVCGRRQERFPDASVYNRLCQREWTRPAGETTACGGDAIARVDAVRQVGGFRETLIAGEEPELCIRLRQNGWKIWRLDAVMTLHDAAMTRFAQWWRRMVRGGHAFGEVSRLHFRSAQGIWARETARALVWGLILPLVIIVLGLIKPVFLAGFLVYPLQIARIALRDGASGTGSWTFAALMTLAKFAEAYGIVRYYLLSIFRSRSGIIEYK